MGSTGWPEAATRAMLILSWNFQGMERPLTVQILKGLISTHCPTVVFLMETKNKAARGVVSPPDRVCSWAVALVYAPPQRGNHRGIWGQFKRMVSGIKYPLLCIGDFNEIRASGEKQGGVECCMSQLQFFVELLSDYALMDLEFNGALYTWSNNQLGEDNIRERLDRAVATVDWRALYSCA
ncbi:uncharacterized protein LOC114300341 [Camellia sinensis]|uniref:uncharacterized protein LOC114300341 n=1 Tax=Camellia sinensis TaxID=4442 RepID=UPI001036E50F|nr:uncharacterized protein LOC114300341 [Camellia sinensis]